MKEGAGQRQVAPTDGRRLADRALSRLLRGDWPRTLEEMEEVRRR